ncbi:MAG: hypothetical protein COB27_001540 [Moritella sp.]|uniref:hypothetical protein n=1 Tax=Moritella sp. TaxID=78556 RepID=UPI002172AA4D|nr:hypothetical protein [Moritella sp.]MBL1415550.1 hypothetical protein [Moritella sp.]
MKEIIILLLIFFNAYGMTLLDKDLSSHVSITGLASIDSVIDYFLWVIYFTLIWFVLLMDKYFGKPMRASKA